MVAISILHLFSQGFSPMNNHTMEQMRTLLMGEVIQDLYQRINELQERLDSIEKHHHNHAKKITQLSHFVQSKFQEYEDQDQYKYIKDTLNSYLEEKDRLRTSEFTSLREKIAQDQKRNKEEFTQLRNQFNKGLKLLQKDYNSKMVSKASLAEFFFEYSIEIEKSAFENTPKICISKKRA